MAKTLKLSDYPMRLVLNLAATMWCAIVSFFDKTLPIILLTAYLLLLIGNRSAGVHRCRRGIFLVFIMHIFVQFQNRPFPVCEFNRYLHVLYLL